jgi:hypothetical protein
MVPMQFQNKKLEILSIKSCKGVMIKNVKGIISMPVYLIIFLNAFSGILQDMLIKKTAQLIEYTNIPTNAQTLE